MDPQKSVEEIKEEGERRLQLLKDIRQQLALQYEVEKQQLELLTRLVSSHDFLQRKLRQDEQRQREGGEKK